MGSRIGCMVAGQDEVDVSAVVCLGYPLKGMKGAIRDQTLLDLKVPVMFVQGSKDSLCPLDKLKEVMSKMCCETKLHVIDGGDHSLKVGKKMLNDLEISQDEVEEKAIDSINSFLEGVFGSQYKVFQEFNELEEPAIRRYTKQILLGLEFLHKRNVIHRDIKCANVLVDQDGVVKLADFGLAKYIREHGVPFSMKGSPYWMSPEVIKQKTVAGYEYVVDIWCLGCSVLDSLSTGS